MQRAAGPVRRSIVGVAVTATLLVACSPPDEAAETEVLGVTIERSGTEDPTQADGDGDEPQGPAEPPDEDTTGDEIGALVLLRSGSLAVGTVWLAAAGEWIGLDGQTLDLDVDADPSSAHLDVVLEPEGDRAVIHGCTLRLVAPEDASFEAFGVVSVEVVLEQAGGNLIREPVEALDIEVSLSPGQMVALDVAPEDEGTIEVGAGEAVQVHCEGRFDRA